MNCVMNRSFGMGLNMPTNLMVPNTITCAPTNTNTNTKSVSTQRRNLVIFDWDDTLFPTTALVRNKESVNGIQLQQFGQSAFSVLTQYIDTFSAENIYIVTNGKNGWVQNSLRWLSSVQSASYPSGVDYWALIQQLLATLLSGHVISAQHLHGAAYPNQTALWKTLVFQQIAIEHFGANGQAQGECNVISIGDSEDEFIASAETQKMLRSQFGVEPVHLVRLALQRRASFAFMQKQFNVLSGAALMKSMTGSTIFDLDVKVADYV